ncbi:NUDIX hydrolase [Taibaiella soli]|uniref:NUDIX hydrolase n=1 Tax=Taibaiella soli TaxID=1649169 RepID=A0A2W2ADD4_9BACT|nr:NUDIX domain-containing protein [Taibaiella soli]PZF73455.1 NUDIX hydrolase [Taibaiella soli]
MNFFQKIYYNNKPLILTTDSRHYINMHDAADYLLLTGAIKENYLVAMEYLESQNTPGVIIADNSEQALLDGIHQLYSPIDAAGGVVFNERNEVLMIYRRGKWDLPKGKRDEGEDMEACALREVEEETGLKKLTLGKKISDTYHVYAQHGQHLLKRTAWYEMHTTSDEKLVPQQEENIEEARWVSADELPPILEKTYEAIIEVLGKSGIMDDDGSDV